MKELKLSLIVAALDRATSPLRKIGGGLKTLEERTERLGKSFKKLSLTGFLGGGLVIGGAIEAGRGLYELTNKTAELGEGFLHAGIKAGASVETMQRLGFAAKQLGVDQDGLSQVFFRFQTHLANGLAGQKETRKALGLLGISMQSAKRLSKDPHEAFLALVDGFTKIRNPTLRAKLAMDLFSRSGYQILPMLTAGRGKIKEFEDQLTAANAVMSGADAQASEEFIQKKNRMALVMQGLQMRIGVGLIPVMSRLVDKLAAVVTKMKPAVVERFTASMEKLIDQLPALISLGSQLLDFIAAVTPRFLAWTDKVGGLKTVLTALGVIMAGEFAGHVLTAVGALFKLLAPIKLLGVFLKADAIATLGLALAGLIEPIAGTTAAMWLLDAAMWANPIGVVVGALLVAVGAAAAFAFGVSLIIKNWGKIGPAIGGFLTRTVDAAKLQFDALVALAGRAGQVIADIFTGRWTRIGADMADWTKQLGTVGAAFTVNGAPGAVGKPGAAAPDGPHGRAAATGPRPIVRTPASAAAHPNRTDLHLHLTGDAAPKAKKISATGADLTIHRGLVPA